MHAAQGASEQVVRATQRVERARRELAAAEADLHRWTAGAEGERLVADTLAGLEVLGWRVLHDVHWPGRPKANLDHVLVGPGGIVVVDAKNWSGHVEVRGGVLRCANYAKHDVVEAAKGAVAGVAALLEPAHRRLVVPVLCFVQQDLAPVLASGVWVMGRDRLAAWLTALPAVLDPNEVYAIWAYLGRTLDGATSPALMTTATVTSIDTAKRARRDGQPSRRSTASPPTRQARRSRGTLSGGAGPTLLKFAAVLVIVFGFPVWFPVLSSVVGSIAQDVMPTVPTPTLSVPPTTPVVPPATVPVTP